MMADALLLLFTLEVSCCVEYRSHAKRFKFQILCVKLVVAFISKLNNNSKQKNKIINQVEK